MSSLLTIIPLVVILASFSQTEPQNISERNLLEVHIEVAGNTIEVTVSLPGAVEITVFLEDANNIHQSKKVQGSFGSVVFNYLPPGLTKIRAEGRRADGTEYSSEWYEVTVQKELENSD